MDLVRQPPLLTPGENNVLHVAVSSIALGGMQKIVLDWAIRIYPRWRVNLIIIRKKEDEWPIPDFIQVTRIDKDKNKEIIPRLVEIGREIAASPNSTCVCHLLHKHEMEALAQSGVFCVPVLHNARVGWLEDGDHLLNYKTLLTVSKSSVQELRECGYHGDAPVIYHVPRVQKPDPNAREVYRTQWKIPHNATVIGMIGGIKPQKNYLQALHVLKELHTRRDAYLVIIGWPSGRNGKKTWLEIRAEIDRLGLRHRVSMPGFVQDAMRCLPAFDVVLNTSFFEGFSMATLEVVLSGKPTVASRVGGQGDIGEEGQFLLPLDAPLPDWADALEQALDSHVPIPPWANVPTFRQWTIANLLRPVERTNKMLFVTINLNLGGAQRSLVNLAKALVDEVDFEVAVTGTSSTSHFYEELMGAGVTVWNTSRNKDAYESVEMLVRKIVDEGYTTVCFWNECPKVKLLLTKFLGFEKNIRFIDVSPGGYSFDEMDSPVDIQRMFHFTGNDFYKRLDTMVLKYHGESPAECDGKTVIIPNGVPEPKVHKTDYEIRGNPKIVVNGRIVPSKFILEILEAMCGVWKQFPTAELHFYGEPDKGHENYAAMVHTVAREEEGRKIFFHDTDFDAKSKLQDYDLFVVLGKHQGCPNALLEALALGLPSIGNDDGGTREQLINGETGLLVHDTSPEPLAAAIITLLQDRTLAKRLGEQGRHHVLSSFSMELMVNRYLRLFNVNTATERHNTLQERSLAC